MKTHIRLITALDNEFPGKVAKVVVKSWEPLSVKAFLADGAVTPGVNDELPEEIRAFVDAWTDYEPLKSYSPYKILEKAEQEGLRPQFEALLQENGLFGMFTSATVLLEDNPKLIAAIPLIKTELGLTDEQIASMLEYAAE